MSSRMMQVDTEENLKGAFKVFDPELTGFIDADQLKATLTKLVCALPLTRVG
jgi:Ca2+-binding EF-hand superfamily protein